MSDPIKLYDGDADELMSGDHAEQVCLLPGDPSPGFSAGERIRVPWGQDMLRDMLDGRYRAVVCGVNDEDNSHGIVAQLVHLVTSSQWTQQTVTNYAKVFQESVSVHAAHDHEPYVLKYDLDSILVLALLRPKGQDHFTTADLSRGFSTVSKMLKGRGDRLPVASVSFLGARSNRLLDENGKEPSFETVLRTMFQAGYRGDVYPAPTLWSKGDVGVFATYPFPEGVQRMREGSS